MGQYQARSKSIDEEQAPGTPEHRLIKDGDAPVFGSPIGKCRLIFRLACLLASWLCGDHGMALCLYVGDSFLGSSVSPAITPTKKIPGSDEQQSPHLLTRQKINLEDEKSEWVLLK